MERGRIEGKNIKAKLQTGELSLDMAEYMGEYKIIRRMDGGGNANVFVAENARGEEVAIKILREESGNGKKAVKRNRKKRIRFKIETEMVVGIQDEIASEEILRQGLCWTMTSSPPTSNRLVSTFLRSR